MTVNLVLTSNLPATWDYSSYRGDDDGHTLRFFSTYTLDDDGEPVGVDPLDLTGAELLCQVRAYANSDTVLATYDINDTDAADGVIVISLSSEVRRTLPARELWWDCQRSEPTTKTFWKGVYSVDGDISRPVTP